MHSFHVFSQFLWYCFFDEAESRREGFYAPPPHHRAPPARETREREGRKRRKSGNNVIERNSGTRAEGERW
jgi:hypothetical protein